MRTAIAKSANALSALRNDQCLFDPRDTDTCGTRASALFHLSSPLSSLFTSVHLCSPLLRSSPLSVLSNLDRRCTQQHFKQLLPAMPLKAAKFLPPIADYVVIAAIRPRLPRACTCPFWSLTLPQEVLIAMVSQHGDAYFHVFNQKLLKADHQPTPNIGV